MFEEKSYSIAGFSIADSRSHAADKIVIQWWLWPLNPPMISEANIPIQWPQASLGSATTGAIHHFFLFRGKPKSDRDRAKDRAMLYTVLISVAVWGAILVGLRLFLARRNSPAWVRKTVTATSVTIALAWVMGYVVFAELQELLGEKSVLWTLS